MYSRLFSHQRHLWRRRHHRRRHRHRCQRQRRHRHCPHPLPRQTSDVITRRYISISNSISISLACRVLMPSSLRHILHSYARQSRSFSLSFRSLALSRFRL